MKYSPLLASVLFLALCSSLALAHSDILVAKSGDGTQLVTGGYDFDVLPGNPVIPPPVRVFGYDFGENYTDPFFADDPGFVAVPGTFAPGTTFSFDVQDDLKYWSGSGPIGFGPVPSGESLLIAKGTSYVSVGSGGTYPLTGVEIGTADASPVGQQLHEHISVYLLGSDGNSIPANDIYDINPPHDLLVAGDGVEAASGVYLLKLTLRTSAPGLADSDPFWIVYNAGMAEDVHDAAIDWAASHLAPEPASALLLVLGGSIILVRYRRMP